MARSIKKGPYVEDALMTKVSALNGRNEKSLGPSPRREERSVERDSAHDAPVALQDAARHRSDPRQGCERGSWTAPLLQEARGEADRESPQLRRGQRRVQVARRHRFDRRRHALYKARDRERRSGAAAFHARCAGARHADQKENKPRRDRS